MKVILNKTKGYIINLCCPRNNKLDYIEENVKYNKQKILELTVLANDIDYKLSKLIRNDIENQRDKKIKQTQWFY